MQTLYLFNTVRLILLIALIFLVPPATYAAVDLDEGWEYRWGDSPLTDAGVPEWVLGQDPGQWSAIGFPSNPPDRNGQEHVWYRITLPEGEWQEPVLYIYSVDLILSHFL